MSVYQWVSLTLAIVTVIVTPLMVLTIRIVVRFARMEDKLIELTTDIKKVQVNHDRRLTRLELWRARGR